MKKNIQFLLLLIFISGVIVSCKKMDHTYRQFVEGGEVIYIAKADSLKMRAGKNQAELTWLLLSDPKVHEYKIYWNSKSDSLSNTVQKTKDVDTVRVLIENLTEGTHEFEVIMFDKHGNSSVKNRIVGKVYGERYQRSLVNRIFRNYKRLANVGVELDLMDAEPQLLFSEVKYTNSNGTLVNHVIKKSAKLDTLRGLPVGGAFQLRSVFLPTENALDTFYTDYQEIRLENPSANLHYPNIRPLNEVFELDSKLAPADDLLSSLFAPSVRGLLRDQQVNLLEKPNRFLNLMAVEHFSPETYPGQLT